MPSLITSALEPALLPELVTTGTSEENGEMTMVSPLDGETEWIIPEMKEMDRLPWDTESQKAKDKEQEVEAMDGSLDDVECSEASESSSVSEDPELRECPSDGNWESSDGLPLKELLAHPKYGTYHRRDEADDSKSGCRVRCSGMIAVSSETFPRWRSSRITAACTRCFPQSGEEDLQCRHIYGRLLPTGVCAKRCRNAHVSFFAEHDCFMHDPGERASKRSKVIDIELNLLHAEIQQAQNSINIA